MALVTREEFAVLCKTTVGIVNTNVSREKITVSGKLIDTLNPLNKVFMKLYKARASEKARGGVKSKPAARQTKPKQYEPLTNVEYINDIYNDIVEKIDGNGNKTFEPYESAANKKQRAKQNKDDGESVDFERRKKVADALKAEWQAEKEQLQVEKMMGNLMPVDLVEEIIRINIQDIFKTFENDLINVASIYCDILAGGDREKLSKLVATLRQHLTRNVDRVKQTAAKQVESCINEYSETRSRGERK